MRVLRALVSLFVVINGVDSVTLARVIHKSICLSTKRALHTRLPVRVLPRDTCTTLVVYLIVCKVI